MTVLLDTSALIAHHRDEKGADAVQALFDDDGETLLVASPSIPEFARRLRELGASPTEARVVVATYLQALDGVVPIDADVAFIAFELTCKAKSRLPLVDALIAAAAIHTQARLVHRDSHMRALAHELLPQDDLDHQTS